MAITTHCEYELPLFVDYEPDPGHPGHVEIVAVRVGTVDIMAQLSAEDMSNLLDHCVDDLTVVEDAAAEAAGERER
jgi:hypothetical protein